MMVQSFDHNWYNTFIQLTIFFSLQIEIYLFWKKQEIKKIRPLSIIQYVYNVFVPKIAFGFFVAEATSHTLDARKKFSIHIYSWGNTQFCFCFYIFVAGMTKCRITLQHNKNGLPLYTFGTIYNTWDFQIVSC